MRSSLPFVRARAGLHARRREAAMAGEIKKPRIEARAVRPMLEHGAFLIVDQHLGRYAAEPLEGPHQALVGVLGIFGVRAPEMEPPGVAQSIDAEIHGRRDAADGRLDRTPVTLQLPTWLCLEAHRRSTRTQGALRPNVVPQNRGFARLAARLDLPEDHNRIPDALRQ